ncbi:MAG: glycerol-3-phosphate acyltransferase [Dehalococcoidales bacterium]|nr:glycerol-3-phosphate acyltransferase [Dehalococcoidales bacterium]
MATALGDVAKGAAAMVLPRVLPMPEVAVVFAAVAVVGGHIWPIFLQFRGGAGLATALGATFVALPRESLILLIPFVVLVATVGRKWELGVTGALLLIPFIALTWWFGEPPELIGLPIVLTALVGARVYWREMGEVLQRIFTRSPEK